MEGRNRDAAATLEASCGLADSLGGASDMTNHTTHDTSVKLCECGCGQPVHTPASRFIRGHQHYRPIAQRFWEKVNKGAPNGCWEWLGCLTASGYGQIRIDDKMIRSHRYAWELENGPIPDGTVIMHTCDNPRCVNPSHLHLGTQVENIADRMTKSRQARGVTHSEAKLTGIQVVEIRRKVASGATPQVLAAEYKVSKATIYNIAARRIWKHIP